MRVVLLVVESSATTVYVNNRRAGMTLLRAERVRRVKGLPSYTERRYAAPERARAPRRETREPAPLERAAARRTDREPGRRRARSRDYARTGRCSRRPAP
jgi:hypothetical protein